MDADYVIDLLRQFADCLEHPDPERNPLGKIEDLGAEAVPRLLAALDHDDAQIRGMAVCALGCLHAPDGGTFDLLPAVPVLEETLQSDSDSLVRLYAAEALWTICEHEASLQIFMSGLYDDRVEARRHAAAMLGAIGTGSAKAIEPLIDALTDSDVLVRRYAAENLASLGPAAAAALPKLESLLGEDEWTRVIAVEAILEIAPARTAELCPVLVEALRSRSPRIRHWAAQSLGAIPAAAEVAVSPLVDALDDAEELVRTGAMSALEHLGSAAAPALPALAAILRGEGKDGGSTWRGMAASTLAEIGPAARDAVPDLLACMEEADDGRGTVRFRLQIARALWRIQREPRFLRLIGVASLTDSNWRVRRLAAQMLGDLGPAGHAVVPHLERALDDGHLGVRREAASSLVRIAGAPADRGKASRTSRQGQPR
jgi:HEAT repeat protein